MMQRTHFFSLFLALLVLLGSCAAPDKENQTSTSNQETAQRQGADPYLTQLYWELNNSPMQQKLRNVKPFPVGVVYYQQRGDNLDSAKKEFEIIEKLGFTALKQVQLVAPDNPEGFRDEVFNAALDAGITPWYYGKGGWAPITQQLVDSLGIDQRVSPETMPEIQNDPKMIAFQTELMRLRIERMKNKPPKPKGMGEPGRNNPWLPERLIPYFAHWLEAEYGTLDKLKQAWNCGFIGTCPFTSFQDAAKELQGKDFDQYGNGIGKLSKDFRRYRDAMRFQADLIVKNYQDVMTLYTNWAPLEPERTGGHQIFENQAINTWDLEGQAKAASIGGSFYASIHLAHHFFLVNGELTKPVYMQARTVADMFKGGWAATWESTGGPTNHSGYFPYTVKGETMQHLMLSYIAAGLKGIGFWMWNSRGEGWEVGEYALCDVQGKPSERAKTAGQISRILQQQRFELWEALDEPVVGVLYSWETEAMLGRMSLGQYELNIPVYKTDWDKQFRQYHSQAKIGISRALMNENIPFEYVTERDLAAGLAARYQIIYLPYTLSLDQKTIDILQEYVKNGGRIVADMPAFMIDNYGRLNKQHKGSWFEEMFGFQTADYYHTFNSPKTFAEKELNSYFGDLKITHAQVVARFDDNTPAVLESKYGKGSVLMFNFEAGREMFQPGNEKLETYVVQQALGNVRPQFVVEGNVKSMVFRRSAPKADHYFVINDGEEEYLTIRSDVLHYQSAKELLSGDQIEVNDDQIKFTVPAGSGVWIRCVKK